MADPKYRAADYLSAMQSLFPRGKVWPRDSDAVQTQVLSGLTPTYERSDQASIQLLQDAFPATALAMLPEWESALGLPDPCAGAAPTLLTRRAQVVSRLASVGGQSIAYMIAFAARLGYTISITQFIPARAGILRAGKPCCGNAWAHAWQVNAPLNTIHGFLAGISAAGEPLSSSGNAILQCELQEVAPAHTTVIFSYS